MKLRALLLTALMTIFITPQAHATYSDFQIKLMIKRIATQHELPVSLAMAVAQVESDFNEHAVSHAGAIGVMQIMPATAEQVFGVSPSTLENPTVNIDLGVRFLKQLINTYNGRVDIALSHYNGGSAVRGRWGQLTVIPATQGYVNDVMRLQTAYTHLDDSSFSPATPTPQPARWSDSDNRLEQLEAIKQRNMCRFVTGPCHFYTASTNTGPSNPVSATPPVRSPWESEKARRIALVQQWEAPLSR